LKEAVSVPARLEAYAKAYEAKAKEIQKAEQELLEIEAQALKESEKLLTEERNSLAALGGEKLQLQAKVVEVLKKIEAAQQTAQMARGVIDIASKNISARKGSAKSQ
jgi:hypothetical protein